MTSKTPTDILKAYQAETGSEAAKAVLNPSEPKKKRIKGKSLVDIVNTHYPEPLQPVRGLICEGLTLLVGASKIGKSWFVLDMCLSVAAGEPFLGKPTTQGHVLYLALEDVEARLKDRTLKITQAKGIPVSPALECLIESPTIKEGLLDDLQAWIDDHQPCRLIVIDTLQAVRGLTQRGNVYELDNEFIKPIKALAERNHVAIIMTHHVNKSKDTGDPFDRVSGSAGLMGKADTTIMMSRKRGSAEGSLTFTGRDIIDRNDMILRFEDCIWSLVSADADEYTERKRYDDDPVVLFIKDLLTENPHGIDITYADAMRRMDEKYQAHGINSPRDLAGRIKQIADDLLYYDDLSVSLGVRFNRGAHKGMTIVPRPRQMGI